MGAEKVERRLVIYFAIFLIVALIKSLVCSNNDLNQLLQWVLELIGLVICCDTWASIKVTSTKYDYEDVIKSMQDSVIYDVENEVICSECGKIINNVIINSASKLY